MNIKTYCFTALCLLTFASFTVYASEGGQGPEEHEPFGCVPRSEQEVIKPYQQALQKIDAEPSSRFSATKTWLKEHPKTVVAIAAGVVAVGTGAYYRRELRNGVLGLKK